MASDGPISYDQKEFKLLVAVTLAMILVGAIYTVDEDDIFAGFLLAVVSGALGCAVYRGSCGFLLKRAEGKDPSPERLVALARASGIGYVVGGLFVMAAAIISEEADLEDLGVAIVSAVVFVIEIIAVPYIVKSRVGKA